MGSAIYAPMLSMLRGRDTSLYQKFLRTLFMRAYDMRNSRLNHILHGDQTVLEENFYGVDHCHLSLRKFNLHLIYKPDKTSDSARLRYLCDFWLSGRYFSF